MSHYAVSFTNAEGKRRVLRYNDRRWAERIAAHLREGGTATDVQVIDVNG